MYSRIQASFCHQCTHAGDILSLVPKPRPSFPGRGLEMRLGRGRSILAQPGHYIFKQKAVFKKRRAHLMPEYQQKTILPNSTWIDGSPQTS